MDAMTDMRMRSETAFRFDSKRLCRGIESHGILSWVGRPLRRILWSWKRLHGIMASLTVKAKRKFCEMLI